MSGVVCVVVWGTCGLVEQRSREEPNNIRRWSTALAVVTSTLHSSSIQNARRHASACTSSPHPLVGLAASTRRDQPGWIGWLDWPACAILC